MAQIRTIALFGESVRGDYQKGVYCKSLTQLFDTFGEPPPESRGLFFAVQAILYHYHLIYFRVKEEGYSSEDYLTGVNVLKTSNLDLSLSAVFAPGVGNLELIRAISSVCGMYHSVLITTEADLYDYLTELEVG